MKSAQSKMSEIKKLLKSIREKSDISQAEMARCLNTSPSSVSRLEDYKKPTNPSLARIINYANAAGYDIILSFKTIEKEDNK